MLRMTGQVLSFPLNKLLVFMVFFGLHGVDASSLIGLHDLVLVSVVTPFFKSSYVILCDSSDFPQRRLLWVFFNAVS